MIHSVREQATFSAEVSSMLRQQIEGLIDLPPVSDPERTREGGPRTMLEAETIEDEAGRQLRIPQAATYIFRLVSPEIQRAEHPQLVVRFPLQEVAPREPREDDDYEGDNPLFEDDGVSALPDDNVRSTVTLWPGSPDDREEYRRNGEWELIVPRDANAPVKVRWERSASRSLEEIKNSIIGKVSTAAALAEHQSVPHQPEPTGLKGLTVGDYWLGKLTPAQAGYFERRLAEKSIKAQHTTKK